MFFLVFVCSTTYARTIYQSDTEDTTDAGSVKSPGTGRLISAAGTIGLVGAGILMISPGHGAGTGSIMIASGIIVGPSFGYFYANETGRGLSGIAVRTGIVGGSIAVGLIVGSTQKNGWDGLGTAVLISSIGALAASVLALDDVVSVGNLIEENNKRLGKATISLHPAYFPQTESAGLSLQIIL
jgi:hypothetical protein